MEDPHIWDQPEEAQKKMKLLASLKNDVSVYEELISGRDDIRDMIEMADEEADPELVPEVQEMFEVFKTKYETLRMKTLLSGEYDGCNAIVTLHAGTGGTEAMDWTGMLYRMYSRWAEAHGYQVEVLDLLEGEEAGLKSVTFQVNGENAYGLIDINGEGAIEHIVKQRGYGNDPLDQRSSVGWKAFMCAAILCDDYILRVESGSSFGPFVNKAN